MALALFPTALNPTPRKRGRRPVAESPAERAKHAECLKARLWGVPYKQIAARLQVAESTVYRWVRAAQAYDDPVAVALQEAARNRSA